MNVYVKYVGRVYDYVSWEASVNLSAMTSIKEITAAADACRAELASKFPDAKLEGEPRIVAFLGSVLVTLSCTVMDQV